MKLTISRTAAGGRPFTGAPGAGSVARSVVTVLAGVASLALIAACFTRAIDVSPFALWARGAGVAGGVALVTAHVAFAVLCIPSWPVRVAAGLCYGATAGFGLALGSTFVGCVIAFALGRRLFRGRIEDRIANDPRLAAIDAAVASGGWWIVLLLRLSPVVPNELVNYGLGATRVRLRDYTLATLAGIAPLTWSFVWLGSLLQNSHDLAAGLAGAAGASTPLLWWTGLVTTAVLLVGAGRVARQALERAVAARAAANGSPVAVGVGVAAPALGREA